MSKVQVHDWAQLFKRDPFLADVLDQAQWGPRLYHAIRACGAYYQDQLDCMEAYNLEEGPCKAEINAMQQCVRATAYPDEFKAYQTCIKGWQAGTEDLETCTPLVAILNTKLTEFEMDRAHPLPPIEAQALNKCIGPEYTEDKALNCAALRLAERTPFEQCLAANKDNVPSCRPEGEALVRATMAYAKRHSAAEQL